MQHNMQEYQPERRIRAILEAIPDDMMLVDSEGNIREYKAGQGSSHLPMDRFLGTTLGELFDQEAQALQKAVRAALAYEQSEGLELSLQGRF